MQRLGEVGPENDEFERLYMISGIGKGKWPGWMNTSQELMSQVR